MCELRRAFGVKGGVEEKKGEEREEEDGCVKDEVDVVKEEMGDAEENEGKAIKLEVV